MVGEVRSRALQRAIICLEAPRIDFSAKTVWVHALGVPCSEFRFNAKWHTVEAWFFVQFVVSVGPGAWAYDPLPYYSVATCDSKAVAAAAFLVTKVEITWGGNRILGVQYTPLSPPGFELSQQSAAVPRIQLLQDDWTKRLFLILRSPQFEQTIRTSNENDYF